MTESTTRPTAKEGGCACGAIRYRFEGEPLFVHACHCKHCQRLTGSAFGITMIVAADDFELLSGEPAQGEIRGDSGGRKSAHWCPSCGELPVGPCGAPSGLRQHPSRHPRRDGLVRPRGPHLDPQ